MPCSGTEKPAYFAIGNIKSDKIRDLAGAMIRFERYPRMDDLVEVEGTPEQIERAIAALGLPRDGFTSERLPEFVRRFESRTGTPAAITRR